MNNREKSICVESKSIRSDCVDLLNLFNQMITRQLMRKINDEFNWENVVCNKLV